MGVIIAFMWGLVREITDQTIKNIDFITDDLGLVNLGIVSYVQHMNDMDQAIEDAKVKKQDPSDDLESTDFPQRSRRRI